MYYINDLTTNVINIQDACLLTPFIFVFILPDTSNTNTYRLAFPCTTRNVGLVFCEAERAGLFPVKHVAFSVIKDVGKEEIVFDIQLTCDKPVF